MYLISFNPPVTPGDKHNPDPSLQIRRLKLKEAKKLAKVMQILTGRGRPNSTVWWPKAVTLVSLFGLRLQTVLSKGRSQKGFITHIWFWNNFSTIWRVPRNKFSVLFAKTRLNLTKSILSLGHMLDGTPQILRCQALSPIIASNWQMDWLNESSKLTASFSWSCWSWEDTPRMPPNARHGRDWFQLSRVPIGSGSYFLNELLESPRV